jgi:hypothetical protein
MLAGGARRRAQAGTGPRNARSGAHSPAPPPPANASASPGSCSPTSPSPAPATPSPRTSPARRPAPHSHPAHPPPDRRHPQRLRPDQRRRPPLPPPHHPQHPRRVRAAQPRAATPCRRRAHSGRDGQPPPRHARQNRQDLVPRRAHHWAPHVPEVPDRKVQLADGLLDFPGRAVIADRSNHCFEGQSRREQPGHHDVVHARSDLVAILRRAQSHLRRAAARPSGGPGAGRTPASGITRPRDARDEVGIAGAPWFPSGRDWPCRQGPGRRGACTLAAARCRLFRGHLLSRAAGVVSLAIGLGGRVLHAERPCEQHAFCGAAPGRRVDTLGAMHSRGGPAILAKAGDTAGRAYHAGNRVRPEPG